MNKVSLPFGIKFFIFTLILVGTVGYGLWERGKYDGMRKSSVDPILKEIPDFVARTLAGEELTGKAWLANAERGGLVHFWGTWCGPCEAEFPAFLEFASNFTDKGVNFLLIAVNDKLSDVNKFLKRFDSIPSNVTIVLDENGETLPTFGTVKVPETYLFATNGKNLNKFIGPQEWQRSSYITRVQALINNQNKVSKEVETHQSLAPPPPPCDCCFFLSSS